MTVRRCSYQLGSEYFLVNLAYNDIPVYVREYGIYTYHQIGRAALGPLEKRNLFHMFVSQ